MEDWAEIVKTVRKKGKADTEGVCKEDWGKLCCSEPLGTGEFQA